jgi:recombination protein RecA
MSQALRKLTLAVNRSGTCIMFINQLRQKIGVVFGNPETTTGGNALKSPAPQLALCSRSGVEGDEVVQMRATRVVLNIIRPDPRGIRCRPLFWPQWPSSLRAFAQIIAASSP